MMMYRDGRGGEGSKVDTVKACWNNGMNIFKFLCGISLW